MHIHASIKQCHYFQSRHRHITLPDHWPCAHTIKVR